MSVQRHERKCNNVRVNPYNRNWDYSSYSCVDKKVGEIKYKSFIFFGNTTLDDVVEFRKSCEENEENEFIFITFSLSEDFKKLPEIFEVFNHLTSSKRFCITIYSDDDIGDDILNAVIGFIASDTYHFIELDVVCDLQHQKLMVEAHTTLRNYSVDDVQTIRARENYVAYRDTPMVLVACMEHIASSPAGLGHVWPIVCEYVFPGFKRSQFFGHDAYHLDLDDDEAFLARESVILHIIKEKKKNDRLFAIANGAHFIDMTIE